MTEAETTRRRAPGMTPEDRRKMIVRTALPLVIEYGTAVTTNQVARAAGIGEGTIFRAFKDKDELLDACVAEALKPDDALNALGEIPLDQALADRLAEAAETLSAHLQRMGAVMAAIYSSGHPKRRDHDQRPKSKAPKGDRRRESMGVMREALTDLFEPEKDKLRLPVEQIASLFLSLLFMRSRTGPGDDGPTDREIVDVFLNGAVGAA